MASGITHAYVATGTDAGNGEVHKSEWNAAHVLNGVPYAFAQSGTAVSVGAVTTEQALATISFAGGEIGPNGFIQVTTQWTVTNNANNKALNVRLGGIAGTLFQNVYRQTVNGQCSIIRIWNANSQSAQVSVSSVYDDYGVGTSSNPAITASVNTASAWDLVISGQKASSGDTLTLVAYQVLVCYGA